MNIENLRLIGLNQQILAQLHAAPANARLARITEVQRDCATIHDGQAEHTARNAQRNVLVVGDWVFATNEGWIEQVLEPANQVARRSADGRRQALVSNVDTALLVMGLDQDFNLRRLERNLAMVQACDCAPVIVLTKADISADTADRRQRVELRLPPGLPILALDGTSPQAAEALAPWLGVGQTLVLLGTSGAGKSTLTNTLCGTGQAIGGQRKGDGRGRHTTTARSLHQVPGGACIIDTPGLRSWRPDADEADLAASFDDIASLAAQCQFRDCQHGSEPGCAVRGQVDPDRLQNYFKLLRDARRIEQTPLDRIAERQRWKALMRGAEQRSKGKRHAQ